MVKGFGYENRGSHEMNDSGYRSLRHFHHLVLTEDCKDFLHSFGRRPGPDRNWIRGKISDSQHVSKLQVPPYILGCFRTQGVRRDQQLQAPNCQSVVAISVPPSVTMTQSHATSTNSKQLQY